MPNVYVESEPFKELVKQHGGWNEAKDRVNQLVKEDLKE